MSTKQRWTKQEDKILVQAIKANPQNKAKAFRIASSKVNRSVSACTFRWYYFLSNPESKYYVGCMFTLLGHTSKLENRVVNKVNSKITPEPIKKSIWTKIKNILNIK
jgi:hypothetical protein